MHVAVFKDRLFQNALAVRDGERGHHLRLQIRRESRERSSRNSRRGQPPVQALDAYAFRSLADFSAYLMDFFSEGGNQIQPAADEIQVASGDDRRQHVCAKLNPVRNHGMRAAVQLVYALNDDLTCPVAFDPRPHGAEAASQIEDFRFASRVPDGGRAFRERRRQHDVFRRSDGNRRKLDARSGQAVSGIRMNIAVLEFQLRAELSQTFQVQIDRTRSDRATARKRDGGVAGSCEERPENKYRRPHFSDDIVLRLASVESMRAEREDMPVLKRSDFNAQGLKEARHRCDVRQLRRIRQRQRLFRQNGRRHQRQASVLRSCDPYRTLQRPAAANRDRVHSTVLVLLVARRLKLFDFCLLLAPTQVLAQGRLQALRLFRVVSAGSVFSRNTRFSIPHPDRYPMNR